MRTLSRQWAATSVVAALTVALVVVVTASVRDQPTGAGGSAASGISVTSTDAQCATGTRGATTGPASFMVHNAGNTPQEIYLVKMPEGGSLARTIVLGPGTTVSLHAVLGPGSYAFQCLHSGVVTGTSKPFEAVGTVPANVTPAVLPASTGELQQANGLYLKYVQHVLTTLGGQAGSLQESLAAGNTDQAKAALLSAQQSWQQVGAAYDSFGELGDAIGGSRNASLAPGKDPGFTGLGRIEYGLFHGEDPQSLAHFAASIQKDAATLSNQVPTLTIAKGSLALRGHEILEDALRDRLSGQADHGSGMAFALTQADVQATRTVVSNLSRALEKRRPGQVASINSQLDVATTRLGAMEQNGRWTRLQDASAAQRRAINAAVSVALETLADIPQLLVLPQGSE